MSQSFNKTTSRKDRPQSALFIGVRLPSSDSIDVRTTRTKTELIPKEQKNDDALSKDSISTKSVSTSPTTFGTHTKSLSQKSRSSIQIGGAKRSPSSVELKSAGRSTSADTFQATVQVNQNEESKEEDAVEHDAICTLAPSKNSLDALPSDVIIEIAYFLEPEDVARAAQVCKMWRLVFSSPLVWFKLGSYLIFRRFSNPEPLPNASNNNDEYVKYYPAPNRKEARESVRIPIGPIEYNEQTGQIATATIEQLVTELVKETAKVKGNYHAFYKVFLATYRDFMTPRQLLVKLMEIYNPKATIFFPIKRIDLGFKAYYRLRSNSWSLNVKHDELYKRTKLKIVNVVKKWIHSYFLEDFESDIEMRRLARCFIRSQMLCDPSFQNLGPALQSVLHILKTNGQDLQPDEPKFIGLPPEPIVPANICSPIFNLLEHAPEEEIARQITLIDFQMFHRIRIRSFLSRTSADTTLQDFIKRFNSMSAWTAHNIISPIKMQDRARMLTKMILIAEHLMKLKNINGSMCILAGISSGAAYRLKHTWDLVPSKQQETFHSLTELVAGLNGFKALREFTKAASPPCIPYLGLYMTDLTFVEDGNPTLKNGMINFWKFQVKYNLLSQIQWFQETGYNFQPVPQISKFLNEKLMKLPNEEQIFTMSLERERRGFSRDDQIEYEKQAESAQERVGSLRNISIMLKD